MQDLAVGNYRAFITAAEALHTIGEEMTSVDQHLESLVHISKSSLMCLF